MDNGVTFFTSDTVADAFYAYMGRQISWESFLKVKARWYDGGCPA